MIRLYVALCVMWISTAAHALGGDFTLTDQHGQSFRLSDHRDKVVALFFGYTHCPDICPDTLASVSTAVASLDKSEDVQIVFISVDPHRDTPGHLKNYLAYFNQSAVGLSGSWIDTQRVAKQWNARFTTPKLPVSKDYFVDHTADVYVIERGGKVHGVVPYGLPSQHLAKVLRGALAIQSTASGNQQGLTSLDGVVVDIGGTMNPTILHFWASWCGPCRTEFSDLEAARENVLGLGASFYAVNLGDRREGIERFLKDYPLNYPMLSDRSGYSEQKWAVKTLPQTLLLDTNGEVVVRLEGAQPWGDGILLQKLEEKISGLAN